MSAANFSDHYSSVATSYARFRPRYPPALFAWLAENCPRRELAWDCATGNGQAALALAAHFVRVVASDASAAQIACAEAHPRVTRRVALAEAPALPAASVDLVTVAQALHWFDLESFWREVAQVLRPPGLVAIWCYQLFSCSPEVDRVIARFYREIVGAYWPPERAILERGYGDVAFPFAELAPPRLAMEADWTFLHLFGYLGTWSAVRRYLATVGEDPRERIRAELEVAWGAAERQRLRWPLLVRVGRMAT
jgi:SAM-dependent methyltransferase